MAQLIPYHLTDTFRFSQITGIDSSGILFADGQSIFFQECAQNFSRSYPESKGRCIAERDALAEIPYFEFYTCGKSMRVIFDGLGKRTGKTFREFQQKLESFGYTTYDLS